METNNGKKTRAGRVEPVPFTLAEFAYVAGFSLNVVDEMISDGKLKTVEVGTSRRIPTSEFRRVVLETLAAHIEVRTGVARALRMGIAEEVGINERGEVQYRRTDKPRARRRGVRRAGH